MVGKITRPISPAEMRCLGSHSDEAVTSDIRRGHVSGKGRGEQRTISVYFSTKLGCIIEL